MRSNVPGGVDNAIVVADGALDGAPSIGKVSAALEEIIGAESAMTAMMASLGAGLQGLGPRITPVGALGPLQKSVDASLLLWDANIVHQKARAQIEPAVAGPDPQSIAIQAPPAAELARNRMLNGSDLMEFRPEITQPHMVGLGSLLESPMPQPKARNQSAVVSSLRPATNPANDPTIVPLASDGGNQPTFPSLAKSALITSDTASREPTSALPHYKSLNVTRTASVAQLLPLSNNAIELMEQPDSQTFGRIEATSPAATAPLPENTSVMEAWRKSRDEKTLWQDGRSDELRHLHTPEVSSEPRFGIVVVDGGYLGRWIFDRLSRQVSRPSGGTTGIDPRVSATHPGAAVGV